MCRAITCRKCDKSTWAGCGQHVDQVMKGIPTSKRCQGHDDEPRSGGLFGKLFGDR